MYGLPQGINLEFFHGKTLIQVCFGACDLILHFDDSVSITVTSSLGCVDSSGNTQQYTDFQQSAPAVLSLLNQSVSSAQGDDTGTLTLTFSNGEKLAIYDDSKIYESYIINNQGKIIIV
ncbi:MAG: DUF6188 family protein [Phycisphaerae bacterium]|nr:DUF6188 family protein [Phycisphaerae bacterium]